MADDTQIPITEATEIALKAALYDQMMKRDEAEYIIRELQAELKRRLVPTLPVKKKEDEKETATTDDKGDEGRPNSRRKGSAEPH